MNRRIELANSNGNASSIVVEDGQKYRKNIILNEIIPQKYARNHNNRLCHIHDLEFYDVTYNCIGVSVSDLIGNKKRTFGNMLRTLGRKIIELINIQSGGIGFINFDSDISMYVSEEKDEEIIEEFRDFFLDLNMYSRKGCEKPYVTLNFGLDTTEQGRRCSILMLSAYMQGDENGTPLIFPNLVFKMKMGSNLEKTSPNYYVYQKALKATAKRMIPTYFNCDSKSNKEYLPDKIGVMGCRTRVVTNVNGEEGSINRGNIACVTLNLVQMAYHAERDLDKFYSLLGEAMDDASGVLLHRFERLCKKGNFSEMYLKKYYLGSEYKDAFEMLKNGTLSIGFIGLWDAMSVLYNINEFSVEGMKQLKEEAIKIVRRMREYVDNLTFKEHLNFSLLASAAEGVTGNFAQFDSIYTGMEYKVCKKGFYTNSFHIPVSVQADYREKIELEGSFHELCNGGSITYVELNEMPDKNFQAVQEIVEYAYANDCNYIGVNFPMDNCKMCGYTGRIIGRCPRCTSDSIRRLRRVSGYLAEDNSFTNGKRKELNERVHHMLAGFK